MKDTPLRIGIVGLGFGLYYMKQYMQTDRGQQLLKIAGVCDANPQRLGQAGETFACPQFQTFDAMLADPQIEAVALFSGPVKRAELISRAIRAGKHVMTTKPFELDPVAASNVLEEARRLGKIVHLNSPSATTPSDMSQIFDWQREHNLGRPVAARWETWVRYHEKPDGSWYDDAALCPVAPIFRLGIYAINEILYFLQDPQSVQVIHSRIFTERPTPDQAMLVIKFRDGSLASVFASFCSETPAPYSDRLVLNFERGTVFKNAQPGSSRDKIDLQLMTQDEAGEPLFVSADDFNPEECGGHSSYQWDIFCRAVRGEAIDHATPPRHIIDGVRIVAAMARAELSGKAENI